MDMQKLAPILALVLGIVLLIFFFLPWTSLMADPSEMPGAPEDAEKKKVASANGWQLAVGDLSPEDEMDKTQGEERDDPAEAISARPWFFLALLVPIGLIATGALSMMGTLARPMVSKLMVVLGIVGIIVCLLVLPVNYADDMINHMEDQMEEQTGGQDNPLAEMGREMMNQMREQMKKMMKTSTTAWLWISLILYAGVMAIGVLPAVGATTVGSHQVPPAAGPSTGGPSATSEPPATTEPPAQPQQPAPPPAQPDQGGQGESRQET